MKYLEKHNKLIESINNDIDNLLNENILSDLFTLGRYGPIGLITKKVLSKLKDDADKEKEDLKDEKEELKKKKGEASDSKEKKKIQKDIEEISKTLQDITKRIKALKKVEVESLPFKKIEIKFKKKVSLNIEKLNSPEFERNLLGTMYFSVVGLDKNSKYIDLKTKSFPQTIIIRLYYKSINPGKDQHGKVKLIYNRYGSTASKGNVSGEEKEVDFRIIKTK